MVWIAQTWISVNGVVLALTQKIDWQIKGDPNFGTDKSFLVIANHQSWMDILILQKVFNRKIPFIRFFLKYELIYFPILGWAWWALDFPFMKRHTKEYLKAHPEKRNEDFESTVRACKHFKGQRVSLLNFIEGTRFTTKKQASTASPFQYLLSPKAGGIGFVLNAMGEQFDSILDVTIFYPQGVVTLWEALQGKLPQVVVEFQRREIPKTFLHRNYMEDQNFRIALQAWLKEMWAAKDIALKNLNQAKN